MNQINSQRSEHASQVRAAREKFLGEADEAAKLRLRSNRKINQLPTHGKYRARYFTARWNG
jgi:hypothetical protein